MDKMSVIIDMGSSFTPHSERNPITPTSMVIIASAIQKVHRGFGMNRREMQIMQSMANASFWMVLGRRTLSWSASALLCWNVMILRSGWVAANARKDIVKRICKVRVITPT